MMKFKLPKNIKYALLFLFIIFFTALAGQPFPEGYFHLADPLVMLAAVVLPMPYALAVSMIGCVAADFAKGYLLLAITTAISKAILVLAVKGLSQCPLAQKFPDLLTAPAALLSIPCYYLGVAITRFFTAAEGNALLKQLGESFIYAVRVLQKESLQAMVGIFLYLLLYGIYKKQKEKNAK